MLNSFGVSTHIQDGISNGYLYGTIGIKCSNAAHHFDSVFETKYANSATFVLFNIDPTGNVVNIRCNDQAPVYIIDYIKYALAQTRGNWAPEVENGDPIMSKPFLLPIVYEFYRANKNLSATVTEVDNGQTLHNILWMTSNNTDTSKLGRYKMAPRNAPIDCILLSPLLLAYSPVYH